MVQQSLSRRNFLVTSGSLFMATAVAGRSFGETGGDSSTWPISCRDVHLRETKAPDVWTAMKSVGVNALEVDVTQKMECLSLYHPTIRYSLDSPDAIAALKDDLQKNQATITSLLLATQFDQHPEESLQWCEKAAKAAQALGARAIRIDVVPNKLRGQRDEFVRFSIEMGKKLVQMVEDLDVSFGIENHGDTTNDPAFLDALFSAVESKKLGLTLDTANFYWYGHPLEKLYPIFETYAPRACHTHCKSIHYPDDQKNAQRKMGWEYGKYNCPVYAGDIDFAKVIQILKTAGYNGDLCIENEALGKFPEAERGDVLRKEAEFLRNLI